MNLGLVLLANRLKRHEVYVGRISGFVIEAETKGRHWRTPVFFSPRLSKVYILGITEVPSISGLQHVLTAFHQDFSSDAFAKPADEEGNMVVISEGARLRQHGPSRLGSVRVWLHGGDCASAVLVILGTGSNWTFVKRSR
jgi:hypothetical protein